MKTLYIIPARGGSKGIPGKNIKLLNGKPLIQYTIDAARTVAAPEDICISTDSPEIKAVVESLGQPVPFLRPDHLAADTSGTYEVLLHALDFYTQLGRSYETVCLMQPTSPFRKPEHIKDILNMYTGEEDMILSVGITPHNPYYLLYEESESGYLQKSKNGNFVRRQDCPDVYFINGSVYLINAVSLKKSPLNQFSKVRKYVMDDVCSVDIDSMLDWYVCEAIIKEKIAI